MYLSLLSGLANESEQGCELLAGDEQLGVVFGTSHRCDSEESPALNALRYKELSNIIQMTDVTTVDASDNVKYEAVFAFLGDCQRDGSLSSSEGVCRTSHPVMLLLQSVQTDGQRAQSCLTKRTKTLFGQGNTVGDKSPWKMAFLQFGSHLLQVSPHERFASGNDNHDVAGIGMRNDFFVQYLEKILGGHIGLGGVAQAVASAMQTADVTAQGALPEELLERVQRGEVMSS